MVVVSVDVAFIHDRCSHIAEGIFGAVPKRWPQVFYFRTQYFRNGCSVFDMAPYTVQSLVESREGGCLSWSPLAGFPARVDKAWFVLNTDVIRSKRDVIQDVGPVL